MIPQKTIKNSLSFLGPLSYSKQVHLKTAEKLLFVLLFVLRLSSKKWMKKSLADFKYNGRKENASFYVQYMAYTYGKELLRYGVTALVPVPISVKRKRFRGFNQAEVLAKGLADALGIVSLPLLKRVKHTLPQNGLTPDERRRNLTGSFAWNEGVAGKLTELPKRVALVDDIFTTGTTMEACTKVLQEYGIPTVYGICICIGND